MATYNSSFNNPYPSGWKNTPEQTTPITAEVLQAHTDALQAIDDYLSENPIPESGGGGTGGTTNYEQLDNKPSINGVELTGNKTSADLGITGGGTDNYEDLDNKPKINGIELQGDLSAEDLGLTGGGGSGTTDYNDLENKPTIENIELVGNVTLDDLGTKKQIRISWADFQALSIEEKNDLSINYFIYDYPNTEYTASNIVYDDSLSNIGATNVQDAIQTVANISKGRNQAHVFQTTADMEAWLSNEDNKGLWNKGDNIYIVEIEVPDWWVAEVLEEADAETGYYYKIAQLETQKVDLTNYVTKGSNAELNRVILGGSKYAMVYTENDDIVFRFKKNDASAYFTLNGIFNSLNDRLPLSGGTLTGRLNTQNIEPVTANTHILGNSSNPFSSAFLSSGLYIRKNDKNYANVVLSAEGTTSTNGLAELVLGNSLPTGSDGNANGSIRLYNKNGKYSRISPNANVTADTGYDLPTKGGTIPTVSLSGKTLTINL